MTSYEVNTFKIDWQNVNCIKDVDAWLDKLSPVLDGYVQEKDGTWKKTVHHNRVKVRVDLAIDQLLDKRLEFMKEPALV